MADEKQQTSAIFKRHEQLKRWEDSDTNKCLDNTIEKSKRVQFQDGCVFLAACSSGDRDEVKRLLDRGADINTANIDGLTALHQACIDDNLDMVEFLVENEADVDVCDNEGWTPLHATASCGFSEIARYLLRTKANVAAVNNDGDLPFDICEDDEMERLLQQNMEEQGVDADAARREEEDRMMADANQWLNGDSEFEEKHPKTGATALHVAAAKGYVKVMNVLLQAGADINAKDLDGWTSLHAAAHWGQEESCKILAENMCDMETKNLAGQTAFDVADTELVKLLEELKLKQASLKDQQKDLQKEIIQTKIPSSKRRSSVTRMSVEQKHNVMKASDEERIVDTKMAPTKEEERVKSSSSSCSEEDELSDSETEKKNEINKQTSGQNQPRDRDKPPIMTTVEIREKQVPEMPKIEETVETSDKENLKTIGKDDLKNENEVFSDGLIKDTTILNNDKTEIQKEEEERKKDILNEDKVVDDIMKSEENDKEEKKEKDIEEKKSESEKDKDILIEKAKEKTEKDKNEDEKQLIENVPPRKEHEALKRTISAPPSITEVPRIAVNTKSLRDGEKGTNDIPSWRLGLRKTGSTSAVPEETKKNKINEDDKNLPRSASSPRLAEENENKKNEKNDKPIGRRPFLSSSSFSTVDHNNSSTDRSYEPPKRDEETEMLRKVRAKRARETRRSTQGVTLEEVQQANAVLQKPDTSATVTTATTTTATTTSDRNKLSDDRKSQDLSDSHTNSLSNTSDKDNRLSSDSSLKRTSSSNESDNSSLSWRRSREVRDVDPTRKEDVGRSSSFRSSRSRVDRDLSNSAPSSSFYSTDSTYVPRSRADRTERNALSVADPSNTSLSGGVNLTRSTSLRTDRTRPTDDDGTRVDLRRDRDKDKIETEKSEKDKEEKRPESTAMRSRRMRRERRSTGIANYTAENNEEDDKDKENKDESKDDNKTESEDKSSRFNRYGSASDVPSHMSRPSSYTEYSRSTPSLEKDYKKLYEEEKVEKERLKRDLEQCKRELKEAKSELDRQMKRHEASRVSDTNDKRERRALERKLSEMEEEIKLMDKIRTENAKLKEENRALTRVVAKLSK